MIIHIVYYIYIYNISQFNIKYIHRVYKVYLIYIYTVSLCTNVGGNVKTGQVPTTGSTQRQVSVRTGP